MKKSWRARFWAKVRKTPGCWRWFGSADREGYGQFRVNGQLYYAHRLSFEMAHGSIPDGKGVLHHCDNPPCIRPDHLFAGSHSDNMRDKESKARGNHARGEANNSKLTAHHVVVIRRLGETSLSLRAIGELFGVTHRTVGDILAGRKWRHVEVSP